MDSPPPVAVDRDSNPAGPVVDYSANQLNEQQREQSDSATKAANERRQAKQEARQQQAEQVKKRCELGRKMMHRLKQQKHKWASKALSKISKQMEVLHCKGGAPPKKNLRRHYNSRRTSPPTTTTRVPRRMPPTTTSTRRRVRRRSQSGGAVTLPAEYFGGDSGRYSVANLSVPATTAFDANFCAAGAGGAAAGPSGLAGGRSRRSRSRRRRRPRQRGGRAVLPIEYFGGNSHQYDVGNASKPATTMYDVNFCDGATKMVGGGGRRRGRSRSRRNRSRSSHRNRSRSSRRNRSRSSRRSRQSGGRAVLPIEYFGGNSHQYSAANASKPATTMFDVSYCGGAATTGALGS